MKKHWDLVLLLLVASIVAIVVYRRTVSVCPLPLRPYPSHTFDERTGSGGWYAPATSCQKNEKGEMVLVWYDSYYRYTSNTVTGVWSKKPVEVSHD